MDTAVVSLGRGLHLVRRLRMSGAIPLLFFHVVKEWTGNALPLLLHSCLDIDYHDKTRFEQICYL